MRRIIPIVFLLLTASCGPEEPRLPAPQAAPDAANILDSAVIQTNPYSAMLDGVYDGTMTIGALRPFCDIGIGTFNGLDGELVAVEGDIYQVTADGVARPAGDNLQTPYAVVSRFSPDRSARIRDAADFAALAAVLDSLRDSGNNFYAVKVTGRFRSARTKSMPRQTPPYQPLPALLTTMPETTFTEASGTAEGYFFPDWIEGIGVAGYHLHFITDDRTGGGHLIECAVEEGVAQLMPMDAFLLLPDSGNPVFRAADLTKNLREELSQTEHYERYRR